MLSWLEHARVFGVHWIIGSSVKVKGWLCRRKAAFAESSCNHRSSRTTSPASRSPSNSNGPNTFTCARCRDRPYPYHLDTCWRWRVSGLLSPVMAQSSRASGPENSSVPARPLSNFNTVATTSEPLRWVAAVPEESVRADSSTQDSIACTSRTNGNDEVLHRSFGGWAGQVQQRGGVWRGGGRSPVQIRSQEVNKKTSSSPQQSKLEVHTRFILHYSRCSRCELKYIQKQLASASNSIPIHLDVASCF